MFVSTISKPDGVSECDRKEEKDGRGECGRRGLHLGRRPLRGLAPAGGGARFNLIINLNKNAKNFTSPKVDISDALSEKDKVKFTVHTRTGHHLISFSSFLTRNAEPSHHIPYQRLAFFISNATYPGMPEFAKSEFSVIRLHEVKIMRRIRKEQ